MYGPDLHPGAINPALVGFGFIVLMLSLGVLLSVLANGGMSAWLAKGDQVEAATAAAADKPAS